MREELKEDIQILEGDENLLDSLTNPGFAAQLFFPKAAKSQLKMLRISEEDRKFLKQVFPHDVILSYYDGRDHHVLFLKEENGRKKILHVAEMCEENAQCRRLLGLFYIIEHPNISPRHEDVREGYQLRLGFHEGGYQPVLKIYGSKTAELEWAFERRIREFLKGVGSVDPEELWRELPKGSYYVENVQRGRLTFGVYLPLEKASLDRLHEIIEKIRAHHEARFNIG